MARRGNRNRTGERDTSNIANDPLSSLLDRIPIVTPLPVSPNFAPIQDFRRYHPEAPFEVPLSISGRRVRVSAPSRTVSAVSGNTVSGGGMLPSRVVFRGVGEPALVCVRRKIRKSVLIAKGASGRGRKKFNWRSKIGC